MITLFILFTLTLAIFILVLSSLRDGIWCGSVILILLFTVIAALVGIFTVKSLSGNLEERWEESDRIPIISVANSTKIEGKSGSLLGSGYGRIEEENVYKYFTRAEDGSIELRETSVEEIKIFDDVKDEESWLQERTCTLESKESNKTSESKTVEMIDKLVKPSALREGSSCGSELSIHIPADGIIQGSHLDPRR